MAYTFESRATAPMRMLDASAQEILRIWGRTEAAPGIVTVEQIPGAIQQLEEAVAADDALRAQLQAQSQSALAAESAHAAAALSAMDAVTLRQRTAPLIAMLQQSLQAERDVIWSR